MPEILQRELSLGERLEKRRLNRIKKVNRYNHIRKRWAVKRKTQRSKN